MECLIQWEAYICSVEGTVYEPSTGSNAHLGNTSWAGSVLEQGRSYWEYKSTPEDIQHMAMLKMCSMKDGLLPGIESHYLMKAQRMAVTEKLAWSRRWPKAIWKSSLLSKVVRSSWYRHFKALDSLLKTTDEAEAQRDTRRRRG